MRTFYKNCLYCGKRKELNQWQYCSNGCKKKSAIEHEALRGRIKEIEIEVQRRLKKGPIPYMNLNHAIAMKFKTNAYFAGDLLSQAYGAGYFKVYPQRGKRMGTFAYCKPMHEYKAREMYIESIKEIPKEMIMAAKEKHKERVEQIRYLWNKGLDVGDIVNMSDISKRDVKDMVAEL